MFLWAELARSVLALGSRHYVSGTKGLDCILLEFYSDYPVLAKNGRRFFDLQVISKQELLNGVHCGKVSTNYIHQDLFSYKH